MTTKEEIIHKFIAQSPPGELNDVFNGNYQDILGLLLDHHETVAILTCCTYHDVLTIHLQTDVRALLQDDELLQATVEPAFEQYNKEQFSTVLLPGNEHAVSLVSPCSSVQWKRAHSFNMWVQTIISHLNKIDGSKFFDGKSRKTIDFEHIQLVS